MSMLRQTIRLAASARKAPISLTPSRRFCSGGDGIVDEDLAWYRSAIYHIISFGVIWGLGHVIDYRGKSLRIKKNRLKAEVMNEWLLCRDLEEQMRDLRLQAETMKSRQN